ncbi:hypothetical protein CG401_00165 [Bifidobacteriaceae bacterium NR019]|uniref:Uncharacterized protein n=1 Tax=Gardnerella leopoldii TaxID=2792978 RepID=A0ABX4SGS7_9BIFI|nr:hypothetical protein CYJ60_05465 [Gardnerella vaginalis]PKZ19841.1 hypothetical protein CYJ59_05470 [Gardnerella vaginalis]RFT34280.1 hypothetical protein CG401_00165 [Bifidobacteriaceae bacterium NR019]RFT36675.1 hypothetical protein CG400_01915 [Bifidobacteriaceae bacterium NR017]RIY30715.1 hypothetical protein CJI48_02765 [Bifidobacteriaceae bacterium GH005]
MRVLAAELALKAHRAFNLSKLTLRVAFARYALSATAGRRANQRPIVNKSLHLRNKSGFTFCISADGSV